MTRLAFALASLALLSPAAAFDATGEIAFHVRGGAGSGASFDAERIVGVLSPSMFYTKFHSPTQAEKILKAQKIKKPAQWNELVTLSDPGTTLVPASDPRSPVGPRAIEFEIVNTEEQ